MKDSFLLHHDTLSVINELTDEQAGQLIKEILAYSQYINNPTKAKKPNGLNGLMNSVLYPFQMQLERDLEKYSKKCKANAENGKKGGRPPKVETQNNPTKAKKADKDKDKDKDINSAFDDDFEYIWKNYTLGFIKKQGRSGGSKSKAKNKYLSLRKKHSKDDILNMVRNHTKLKIGHKDLERVLTEDMMIDFIDSSKVETKKESALTIDKLKVVS